MEETLGVAVFERNNGGTKPTVAGREFLHAAARIISQAESAFRNLQIQARGENGRLGIGVYASFSTGNTYATLAEHHRNFPEVEIYTLDGDHGRLLSALNDNSIDIAIMTSVRSGWDGRVLSLWSERVIVALNERHRLAQRETIAWSDLAGENIILPQQGVGFELEHLLSSKLSNYGAQRLLRQEAALDRLLSLVNAECGILLVLEGATGIKFNGVTYREVGDVDGPTRLNFEAYWRDDNKNPTLAPLVSMLRQRYPDLRALTDACKRSGGPV